MNAGPHMHSDPDEEKVLKTRFRAMTPEEKLRIAVKLNQDARKLKAAALRRFHPEWDEEKIQKEVKLIFLYANT